MLSLKDTTIKMAQLNLNRSKNSTWLMMEFAHRNKTPLIFVQEPYTNDGAVKGWDKDFHVLQANILGSDQRPPLFIMSRIRTFSSYWTLSSQIATL